MPGFQVGCLVTRCQPIKDYMRKKSSMFQQPASYVRQMLTVMINDKGNVVLHSQTLLLHRGALLLYTHSYICYVV